MSSHQSDPWVSLGEALKQERLSRGMSLDGVAQQVSLPANIIKSLESEGGRSIPTLFRRAHFERYCGLFGHELTIEATENEYRLHRTTSVMRMPARAVRTHTRLAYVLASLIVVPSLIWMAVDGGADWLNQRLAAPDESIGAERAETTLALPASQLPARRLGGSDGVDHIDASVTLPSGRVEVEEQPMDLGHVLSIEALSETWAEVKDANNQSLVHDLLKPGQTYVFSGQPPFEVLLGRGSAVLMKLNDAPLPSLESAADGSQSVGLVSLAVSGSGEVEVRP